MIASWVPLAAPGEVVVPATEGGAGGGPGWLLGIYGDGLGLSGPVYYACLWVALIASAIVAHRAAELGPRLVWGAILLGAAAFALAPPLLSQDVFSYISYARMSELHAANPYETAPVELPGDGAFPYVGWTLVPSAYGPAFSIATRPLGALGVPAALWTMKAIAALSVLALARLTATLARQRGVEPLGAASWVALSPIALVHVIAGAHNDGLMMLCVIGSALAVASGRELLAGAGLGLAAAVKITGAVSAPFALIGSARRGPFLIGAVATVAAVLAWSLALYGGAALDSLSLLGDNQDLTTRLSLPRIASNLPLVSLEVARAAAIAAYAGLVVWLLIWTWRGADWVRAAGWASFGMLLATSWILPWYLLWVLPFAAVGRDRVLLAATLALCGLQLAYGVPA